MQLEIRQWIGIIWLAFLAFWIISSFIRKRTVRRESSVSRFLHLSLSAVVCLLMATPVPPVGALSESFVPNTLFFRFVGLSLTVAGLAFAIWARVFLGRNWSGAVTVKQDHELVCSGPYSMVRHPIYTGILLALLGTAVTFGLVRGLLAFFVAGLSLWLKSRREELFMVDQFGAEYSAYKRKVKTFIPYVW